MIKVAFANQKGGVGKTTSATVFAHGLARQGYRVLAVDLDPQGNFTDGLGVDLSGTRKMYSLLNQEIDISSSIERVGSIDVIGSDTNLAGYSHDPGDDKLTRLAKVMKIDEDAYDYVIIDTPPSLDTLTLMGLSYADTVILPMRAGRYALKGAYELLQTIASVQSHINPDLTIAGILLIEFNDRFQLSKSVRDVLDEFAEEYGVTTFDATIRSSVVVGESQLVGTDLFSYSAKAAVTKDYEAAIEEFIARNKIVRGE